MTTRPLAIPRPRSATAIPRSAIDPVQSAGLGRTDFDRRRADRPPRLGPGRRRAQVDDPRALHHEGQYCAQLRPPGRWPRPPAGAGHRLTWPMGEFGTLGSRLRDRVGHRGRVRHGPRPWHRPTALPRAGRQARDGHPRTDGTGDSHRNHLARSRCARGHEIATDGHCPGRDRGGVVVPEHPRLPLRGQGADVPCRVLADDSQHSWVPARPTPVGRARTHVLLRPDRSRPVSSAARASG